MDCRMQQGMKPPNKGRGRGGRSPMGRGQNLGRGNILIQHGNKRLIAQNIVGSSANSGISPDHPMYKEFMDFIKSKEGETSNTSQPETQLYSKVVENEENEVYNRNPKEEVILLLENSDLKWAKDPWYLMKRYFEKHAGPILASKYRMHYETILSNQKSAEISHFYPANTKEVYNFSKIIIKKVIASDEWGLSTLREADYIHPIQKQPIRYNYWDYVESFNKVFQYENEHKKHSWFIKICSHIFEQELPNWFCKWWIYHGPTVEILPDIFKALYAKWIDASPIIKKIQNDNTFYKMSLMYFFIEFSIPWILKWNIEIGRDEDNIPCLKRIFYTKFWNKILQKTPNGNYHGQELIDSIEKAIKKYEDEEEILQESTSPFKHISMKMKMKKGLITKAELIASYMEEVKKDLKKTLELEYQSDNQSITSGAKSMDEDAEAQGENLEDDFDIDEHMMELQELIAEGQIIANKGESSTSKDKAKM